MARTQKRKKPKINLMNQIDETRKQIIREYRRNYMKLYRDQTRKRRYSPRHKTRKK